MGDDKSIYSEIRDWAAFHHERLDGTGYPFGKVAAELNVQERMMACVDIYQALTAKLSGRSMSVFANNVLSLV